MASFFIHGVPPVDRPDAVCELKHAVAEAAHGYSTSPIPVYCPADRDTLEIGKHITVTSVGFNRAWSSSDHETLRDRVLAAVQTWVLTYLPTCSSIEVNLDHGRVDVYPTRWERKPKHK